MPKDKELPRPPIGLGVEMNEVNSAHQSGGYSHPAFGSIQADRVTGNIVLYGSDFRHSSFVKIRIATSILHRHLASDWPQPNPHPFIEIALSEAQWAHFVSAMNGPGGTQCTITSKDGKPMPRIPPPVERTHQFSAESKQRMERAKESLKKLAAAIESSGLGKTERSDLLRHLTAAINNIGTNQKFVADLFDDHMRELVKQAKTEIGAYANSAIKRVGIQGVKISGAALGLGFPAPPLQPEPVEDEFHAQVDHRSSRFVNTSGA